MTTTGTSMKEAIDQADLCVLAAELGIDLKVGLQKSPFRDDKKQSFSVFKKDGVMLARDHATNKVYNAWSFAQEAAPQLEKVEIARLVKKAAGLPWDEAGKPSSAPRRRGEGERARRKKREMARTAIPEGADLAPVWAGFIRERWDEGVMHLKLENTARAKLAASRGWLMPTIDDLVEQNLISTPVLPWYRCNEAGARRGVAFAVLQPKLEIREQVIEAVGYHQRFTKPDGGKPWTYVPSVPGKPKSRFQEMLAELQQQIPSYPFVMGNLSGRPKTIAILEGQWDAASFYEAWDQQWKGPIFGLRGAGTERIFLSAYGAWLKRHRPAVWLIGDSDDAGQRWIRSTSPDNLCLKEKLEVYGCRVVSCFLRREFAGKDFNDFTKITMPDAAYMRTWAEKIGVEV